MREAHLRDFIAVVETGSVRAAARMLGLTQAAVSKNLTSLERSLGVQLLIRSAHGVQATQFGRILLRRARIANGELRKAQEEIAARSGGHRGVVSVGLSSTAGALLVPEVIGKFRDRSPGTLVSIMEGPPPLTITALREGRVDFAIGPAGLEQRDRGLRMERLLSTDLAVVARAGHPLAASRDLASLAACEWILAARPGEIEEAIRSAFQARNLPPPSFAVQRDSLGTLLYLLMGTDLLAVTSPQLVEPFRRAGMLVVVPVDVRFPPMVQYLVTASARPLAPAALALANDFRRSARQFRR